VDGKPGKPSDKAQRSAIDGVLGPNLRGGFDFSISSSCFLGL
jgi:hypothetical protein